MKAVIEYHADLKQVQSDAQLCALLAAQSVPFDRLAWWQGLADHCGIAPLLAVARDGEAMAVLPLRRERGQLRALANFYSFRSRPVISPGDDGPRLLAAIASNLAQRTGHVRLTGVPGEDGSDAMLAGAFRNSGWLVFSEHYDINLCIEMNGRNFAEYLAGRPGPLRTTLSRKSAKVATEILTKFDPGAWDAFQAVYADSWKPAEASPAFLRAFAEDEGAAGRLRLGIARAGDEIVAAQMWTVEGGTAFIHKLAHRAGADRLSPGTVLSAALFAHVIDRDRVSVIDYGTRDDAHKYDWMELSRPRYRLDMFRPSRPANWPLIARAVASRLAGKEKHG